MCNVAGSTFTDANPFACEDVVDIHEVIMRGYSKVFSCVYKRKCAVNTRPLYTDIDSRNLMFSNGEEKTIKMIPFLINFAVHLYLWKT